MHCDCIKGMYGIPSGMYLRDHSPVNFICFFRSLGHGDNFLPLLRLRNSLKRDQR